MPRATGAALPTLQHARRQALGSTDAAAAIAIRARDVGQRSRLATASAEQVATWVERVLSAPTLAALLAD
jgi:hypothetical protein